MNKIVLSCVSLLLIGCTQPSQQTLSSSNIIVGTEPGEFTGCLKESTRELRIKCFNKNAIYIALTETKGSSEKEKTISLNKKKKLIIIADVWNVAIPINTSSTPSNITPNKDYRVIEIDINKIIDNRVVIYDKNGKVLFVLNIIK